MTGVCSNLKTTIVKMAGIALKGQCDFVSIMVPPKASIKEKFQIEGKKILVNVETLLI